MLADKESKRFFEGDWVELTGKVPDQSGIERREDGGEREAVLVGFFFGRKARVKIGGDLFAVHDPDGGGQFAVEGGGGS